MFFAIAGEEPDQEGTLKHAGFTLVGQEFAAMDSAREHSFGFNEAISFMVGCETQGEIDYYWDSLRRCPRPSSAGGSRTSSASRGRSFLLLGELLGSGTEEQTARVTEAFLHMKKFDIAELKRAYEGAEARAGGQR